MNLQEISQYAQHKLGCFYYHGIGVDVHKKRAFDSYKIIAENDHGKAQKSLASLYEKGEGTKKDLKQAIYWYKKAIENGCQEAKENLNNLLLNNGN